MARALSSNGAYASPVEAGSSLTDQVYELLKDEILRAERRPGDMLAEGQLADRFSVSKTPVREALRLLARDGWVIVLPRKGYLIRPVLLEDIREIFAIRSVLEPCAASMAATAAQPPDIERLQTILATQASAEDDLGLALNAARAFHTFLVEISGNGRLSRMLIDLLDEVRRLHYLLPNVESHITSREEVQAHRSLIEALYAGDGDLAAEIMHTHVAEVARTLVRGFSGI